jgi:chromosome segregation ATPase
MSNLYELTAELVPLEQELRKEGGEITEDNMALAERVTDLLGQVATKIDGYGKIYRNLEAEAEFIKQEEGRLRARRKTIESNIKRLEDAAKLSLEMRGIKSVRGQLFTVSVQRNGGVPPVELLVSLDKLPEKFKRQPPPVADLEAIREGLKAGDPAAETVAKLGEVGTSLRIR